MDNLKNNTCYEIIFYSGEVAEWFKAVVLKTTELETVPGVRIPPSPPDYALRGFVWLGQ